MLSGWITGALCALSLGMPPAAVVGFGTVAAGASAINDLDHDNSSASRVLGPVSGALANGVQAYAKLVYRLTRGPGDPPDKGAHRGATHALPLLIFPCLVLAVLPQIAAAVAGSVARLAGGDGATAEYWAAPLSVVAVVGFCVLVAADRMGGRVLAVAAWAGAVLGIGQDPAEALVSIAPWVALAVLVGTITHVFGDLVTEYGVYLLAPLLRRDVGTSRERRWIRVQLPQSLAFKTGRRFEKSIVFPTLSVVAVLVFPGVWPAVGPTLMEAGQAAVEAVTS